MDLTVIWAFLIAFAVAAYVVMDGFDLGIGILFPAFRVGRERDQAMNAIAPVWDGNETWLVLGGGGLLAAFPLAYATMLPALYILRLMARAPSVGEPGEPPAPIRTAGITPAPSVERGKEEGR